MDSAKAQEFLDRHGELIMGALSTDVQNLCDIRDDAVRNGWHAIRKSCQEQIDQGIAAMRELELLRGEGNE